MRGLDSKAACRHSRSIRRTAQATRLSARTLVDTKRLQTQDAYGTDLTFPPSASLGERRMRRALSHDTDDQRSIAAARGAGVSNGIDSRDVDPASLPVLWCESTRERLRCQFAPLPSHVSVSLCCDWVEGFEADRSHSVAFSKYSRWRFCASIAHGSSLTLIGPLGLSNHGRTVNSILLWDKVDSPQVEGSATGVARTTQRLLSCRHATMREKRRASVIEAEANEATRPSSRMLPSVIGGSGGCFGAPSPASF